MNQLFNVVVDNKEWIFSGVGVTTLGLLINLIKGNRVSKATQSSNIEGDNNISILGNDNNLKIHNKKDALVELVDLDIEEFNDEGFPIVDIKLRNLGDSDAFIKQVNINVIDCFKMQNTKIINYKLIESSSTYNVLLDDKVDEKILKVSQSVPANSVERFQIILGSDHSEPEIPWIYELSFSILYNAYQVINIESRYIIPVRADIDWVGSCTSDNLKSIARENLKKLRILNDRDAVKSGHFIDILRSYIESEKYFECD